MISDSTPNEALINFLAQPTESISGIGKMTAKRLERLECFTAKDILFNFPFRYENRTQIIPIASATHDESGAFEGIIVSQKLVGRKRNLMLVTCQDETGTLMLKFFHFNINMARSFRNGRKLRCFGKVQMGANGYELTHPELIWLDQAQPPANYFTPFYASTEGLTQLFWRKTIGDLLLKIPEKPSLIDQLIAPDLTLSQALRGIHQPDADQSHLNEFNEHTSDYHRRLIIEELCAHRLGFSVIRQQNQSHSSQPLNKQSLLALFLNQLPFQLTQGQQKALNEILKDLNGTQPMIRLLQGDVGCGKTVIAAAAMLMACAEKKQALMMAPTQLLAEQHFQYLSQCFEPMGLSVALVTATRKKKVRLDADVLVGTHALFQSDTQFTQLALVITDEQHRFGVEQRFQLTQKSNGCVPHQLMMSATPIPRTLAMVAYGDLSQSIISELPANRAPITTSVMSSEKIASLAQSVANQCQKGLQAYWVCPLIEASETINAQAVEERFASLKSAYPNLPIGLIHGRLSNIEKQQVMSDFAQNKLKLLVATTIIEVGVNVPNASIMIVESAQRLGLAQLHQLRGRVGRGEAASQCILIYDPPLSDVSQSRLAAMRQTQDGFKLAEADLKLRGAGELLGTRQTGGVQFQIADLQRDHYLFDQVSTISNLIFNNHPEETERLILSWHNQPLQFATA